ncbi:MAG TPA: TIGR04282 family arsenosugar biosynthesis glycosyltransferase [Xanthobacteraceae bacterium]|nr:TIGR04282 family arsenosugar biosynthesis glycosyltransferase [Xanthobacteraceae bacterium]
MSPADPEPVAVAILAKAPIPGLVKTRLIPVLGPDGAAALQERFIARAVEAAIATEIGPVTLWLSPDAHHPALCALAARYRLRLREQPAGDLGARMHAAFTNADGAAIVIGTDCPALMPQHLRSAAEALRTGVDAVLIGAEDGGYVLIGLRQPQPELFTGLIWSTGNVADETRRRMEQLGLNWCELPPLWDVDRPEDIARMRREGFDGMLAASIERPEARIGARRRHCEEQ